MDLISYTKYFGALAIVIILLVILAFVIKRMIQKKPNIAATGQDIFNSKSASLFVQEVLPIDQKTKIIIVGRDNLRHVILLSDTHSTLIETVSPDQMSQTPDFSAPASNVGSISMTSIDAEQLQTAQSPEPDFSNIKAEPVTDGPSLSANISKQSKAQIKDDLQGDEKSTVETELQDIKDKLQNAKNLADPKK